MQDQLTRTLAAAIPDAADSMIALSRTAEKEDVRFRASKWILEEFTESKTKPQSLPGTSIQIINAIPFERTAYDKGKALPTVTVGNLEVAVPRQIKSIGPADQVVSTKPLYGPTKAVEPAEAKVPTLPKRNG
jgi:hypothetical protein